MTVRVDLSEQDPSRLAIYFVEQKFSELYPKQRYHHVSHLIPAKYVESHLSNSAWFELTPGEKPDELVYPDEELISSIRSDVMRTLEDSGFFSLLDDRLFPAERSQTPHPCHGDYRNSKSILPTCGIEESEFFDVFHVLMDRGGFCDCEILYNAVESSRLKRQHWRAHAEHRKPYNPHAG